MGRTARYAPPVSETTFSFETGGGSQHIVQSIANIARYPAAGGTAPDFRGAIGVTADSVEGVDIQVPIYTFSESHIILNELVTQAYKLSLFQLTAKLTLPGSKVLRAAKFCSLERVVQSEALTIGKSPFGLQRVLMQPT